MSNLTITDEQQRKLLEYLDEARSKHMHMLYLCIAGDVLCAIPGIMLLAGISASRYTDLAGILWFASIIGTVVLFLTGYRKVFGSGCAYDQVKQKNYYCEEVTISQRSGGEGKPPYLVSDQRGKQLICPVYLEFKALQIGSRALAVNLPNGTSFAFTL